MKRWQTVIIGLVVSAVFLYLAMRQADPREVMQAFQTARLNYIGLSLAGFMVTVSLRGYRWSVLTQGRLRPVDSFWLWNAGYLFNNVLPARIGEFARAYLAGKRPQMHFTSALSSIVVERLLDMVVIGILIGVVLLVLPLPRWASTAGMVMGSAAVVGIVILAVAAQLPDRALDIGALVLSMIPRIDTGDARKFLQPFVDGLGGVSDMQTFAASFGLSLLAWLASGATAWILGLAFWRELPVIIGLLTVMAAGLGIAIPAAPAGVGPFEAAVIAALSAVDYDANVARSFALTLHAINFGMTSLLGVIGLLREGVSFSEVAQQAESLSQQPARPTMEDPS